MTPAAGLRRLLWGGSLILSALAALPGPAAAAAAPGNRYVVTARSAADLAAVRTALVAQGAEIVSEIPELDMLVVIPAAGQPASALTARMAASPGVASMVPDSIVTLSPPDGARKRNLKAPGLRSARKVAAEAAPLAAGGGITPDPGFAYRGLQWDYGRIGLPEGWTTTAGKEAVTVGVADTGVDFTHADLKAAVAHVEDFTLDDKPSACSYYGLPSDKELAKEFGGPVSTDWNGHGSWIGGNIAAALNGKGINGLAPKVRLVALKISENCGAAYDSNILRSFIWAAEHGVDVVNISFGGYADRSDPDQEVVYQKYVDAVLFARARGTLIVAAAGNEHVRVGKGGKVLSHGSLTVPGEPLDDLYGLYETPGGIPGVVSVAATGNKVIAPSATCPGATAGQVSNDGNTATCKPGKDRHQPAGQGLTDQLAYYSNYGPRIDVAAPGGARKFNLPYHDRGGTPGFPYVGADLTNVWEDFSTTSNFATDIDCFTFAKSSGFTAGQCYTAIQGTSMAAPHAAAVLALIASAKPDLRRKPLALVDFMKNHARQAHNRTQVLAARDTSRGDLTGEPCAKGYCHLGGAAISDGEAYGAGIVAVP